MAVRGPASTAAAVAAFVLLAGCASSGGTAGTPGDLPPAAPGSISGVVVDQAIRPVAGAAVVVLDTGQATTTGEDGAYVIADVPAGAHVVEAGHPLYDTVQQTVEVMADDEAGATARFQLTRLILATPYAQVQAFDGFLVCSVGFSVYASEECGEGVGVPCEVPVLGCSRLGGQGNNFAQWDFYLDGPHVRSMVVEMTWESTSPTLDEFELNVANDWTCDPFCNGENLNVTRGVSPLYATVDFPRELEDKQGNPVELTSETRFSTFVWPYWGHGDPANADVAVNQPYQTFATAFYYLPAPAGWSFLAGDPLPF